MEKSEKLGWDLIDNFVINHDEYDLMLAWGFELKEPDDMYAYDEGDEIPYTLELIKPMGGMNPYSRYSIGNPQKYFISIVVHFENTINKNLRNSIEQGNIFILKYRYIQNLIHNNQNNNYIDKTVIIKKYT